MVPFVRSTLGVVVVAWLRQHENHFPVLLKAGVTTKQGSGLTPMHSARTPAGEFRLAGSLRLGLLSCRRRFPMKLQASGLALHRHQHIGQGAAEQFTIEEIV